jgi:hypothetical protein
MQAVDQHKGIGSNETITRVFAVFGAVVAALILIAALAYGVIAVANAMGPKAATTSTVTMDTSPAVLAFRAGERESLIQAPNGVNQFRADERGDNVQTAAQLESQFRAGERGDVAPSAQQLQNQFRAGERGDSTQP